MNILIIEDEIVSSRRLQRLLKHYNFNILKCLSSIKQSVEWFKQNNAPDILFLDIHLADGLCFEIFSRTPINCPIIFTTAYSDYSLKAFEYNSISYLLKPVNEALLQKAIKKATTVTNNSNELNQLKTIIKNEKFKIYKTEFAVKSGHKIKLIKTNSISYFKSEQNTSYLNSNGIEYIINNSLSDLESKLNANDFFRVNRQYIINRNAIEHINQLKNNRFEIELLDKTESPLKVSRERSKDFKTWIN